MATVTTELTKTLNTSESNGIVDSLTMAYLVEDIDASSGYDIIAQAMNNTQIPQPGTAHPENYNLGVVNRRARLADPGSNKKVEIEVDYATWGSSFNWGQFVFSGATTLQEVTASVDRNGTQVTVTHNGDTQGVEFNPLFPQSVVTATGNLIMQYPNQFAQSWVGTINSYAWAGNAAGTWLCSNISWDAVDVATYPRTFRFTMEFQHDATGWNPDVVYIDSNTGRPPDGLVSGVGYKTVDWYYASDFNILFPV